MSIKRVLVPLDGSESGWNALKFAAELCADLGAELELVTVMDLGQLEFFDGMYRSHEQVERWQEHLREQILSQAISQLPEGTPTPRSTLLRGPVITTLLGEIKRRKPDLVVMGHSGRGALKRVLIDGLLAGSVSRRLVATSPVPVTVVR